MPTPPTAEQLRIDAGTRTLLAVLPTLPLASEITELTDRVGGAVERGYFEPQEDEEIRQMFAHYLHVRASLHELIREMKPFTKFPPHLEPSEEALKAFVIAWTAACALMRAARYAVDEFYNQPLIREKLDEAEPRFGIPAGQLTRLYKSYTSPKTLIRFFRALRFARTNKKKISALESDLDFAPVIALLETEQPFLDTHKTTYLKKRLAYRVERILSRPAKEYGKVMRGMFEVSGRTIANFRNPFHRKRVSKGLRRKVARMIQPGDVLVTRHDDALSNLFLPGFWPHAAFVIGTLRERSDLGVKSDRDREYRSDGSIRILESKKDGVLFRKLDETLAVDSFVILRPKLSDEERRRAVERALSHEGKLYDFEFDFKRSDCLVCTELVYRAMHGVGPMSFELTRRAGRYCFSAEDLLDQAVVENRFDVLAIFGVKGNRLIKGERAVELLNRSYRDV